MHRVSPWFVTVRSLVLANVPGNLLGGSLLQRNFRRGGLIPADANLWRQAIPAAYRRLSPLANSQTSPVCRTATRRILCVSTGA